MYLNTTALVLRINDYNERDALLTLLTRDHGKITAKARGLRRKNSPLAASCQLLALCEVTLFEYRGMFTINEAHPIELFTPLRSDLQKLALGSYFAQTADVISQEDVPNRELQALVLNCLYAMSEMDIPPDTVKAVYELRIACIAGYTPDLSACCCGAGEVPMFFDLSGGGLLCARCQTSAVGIRLPVNPGALAALRYLITCEPKRLFCFTVGSEAKTQLSHITEAYLVTQLERGFSTLDFYKSLLI